MKTYSLLCTQSCAGLRGEQLRGERSGHTLCTTALVHEACSNWEARTHTLAEPSHFLALAAQAMRRVLIDYAVSRRSRSAWRSCA